MSSTGVKMNRRDFLYASAMSAGALALASCAAPQVETPETEATAAPTEAEPTKIPTLAATSTPVPAAAPVNEAPELVDLVAAGTLPPLDERLPVNPRVVSPLHGIGQYGGTWRFMSGGLGGEIGQAMYGHSPVRYINDGLEIVAGICTSWAFNPDNTELTLDWRKGLRWSDGEPCTVDDVLFWWEDMVLNPDQSDQPPDFSESAGDLMELTKIDDYTLKLTWTVPRPLHFARLAAWPNAGNGPRWIVPAEHMKQFHPKYNSDHKDYVTFDQNMLWRNNVDGPALTAWKVESLEPGVRRVFNRNPYFWSVDTEGNQLPYIDRVDEMAIADGEVQKMQVIQGNIDFVVYHNIFMEDVSVLRESEESGGYNVWFWDSGSGTGMNYFWNYDHPDDQIRALYRNPKFKQAMSHAMDRPKIQKIVYYGTGWPTTGTMTVKSVEFNFSDEAKEFYAQARDAYVEYDPEKAKSLLDEIGVKDVDGDGWREMPDGSKLEVRIDLSGTPNKEANNVLEIARENWQAVGLNIVVNQMPSAEFGTMWSGGQGSIRTQWECTGPPEQMAWGGWLVPQEPSRWAPLCGNKWMLRGTPQEDTECDENPWDRSPPRWCSDEEGYLDGPVPELDELYDKSQVEVDPIARHHIGWDIIRIHMEQGPFIMGTVANYPRIVIVNKKLINVPNQEETFTGGMVNPWIVPCPGQYNPETWAFKA